MRLVLAALSVAMGFGYITHRAAGEVMSGQVDDFQDGTTEGWLVGAASPLPPTNVAGGVGGAEDRFLQVRSAGGSGPGSKLVVINASQWTGDFDAAGITGIAADLRNFGATALEIRLLLEGPGGNFLSLHPSSLAPQSDWQTVVFGLGAGDLTGGTDLEATFHGVTALRIFHGMNPSYPPEGIVATLGIDNVRAVPEPATLALLGALGISLLLNRRLASSAVALMVCLALTGSAQAAIVAGQIDDFQDGTTQGWESGPSNFSPPTNVSTGGPGGGTDRYLKITSRGGIGAGSKLVAFNDLQWTGNYSTAKVASITADLKNLGSTALTIRLLLEGPGGRFVSVSGVALPVGGSWQQATFSLKPGDLTGGINLSSTLANVTKLRIFHGTSTSFPPPSIVASLGVDNLRAIREVITLASIANGNWLAPATWNDGVLVPNAETRTTIGNHTVNVLTPGATLALSLSAPGRLAVGADSTLTVGQTTQISQGTLEIAPTGALTSGGDFSIGPSAHAVFAIGRLAIGSVATGAKATLGAGSSLDLPVTAMVFDPGTFGPFAQTILSAASGVSGSFALMQANGSYLDHGVLLESVVYEPDAVKVSLFQGGAGDVWNDVASAAGVDRMVDVPDIQQILREAKFGSGKPAVWTDGDFNDDNLVTATDIQMVLSANLFKKGPYASAEAGAASATPNVALKLTADGLVIDTQGATINGYVLSSEAGLLTGEAADNLGVFQVDSDTEISGQMFFALSGEHLLGQVTGAGLSAEQLAGDLKLSYTLAGQAGTYEATLVVPEPGTIIMLLSAVLAGLWVWRRRRGG